MKIQQTTANRIINGKRRGDQRQRRPPRRYPDSITHGDKILVDGEVLSGEASIDESMLTGESVPMDIEKYGKVIGGTLLIKGNITMLATKVGANTTLSQIIDLMKKAAGRQATRSKIGR